MKQCLVFLTLRLKASKSSEHSAENKGDWEQKVNLIKQECEVHHPHLVYLSSKQSVGIFARPGTRNERERDRNSGGGQIEASKSVPRLRDGLREGRSRAPVARLLQQ